MAMYTGEIDYFSQQPELHLLNHTLHTDPTLRAGQNAVVFWFDHFIAWAQSNKKSHIEQVSFNTTSVSFPTRLETRLAIQQAQLGPLPIITNSTQFYTFICEFRDAPSSAEVIDDVVTATEMRSFSCGECCIVVSCLCYLIRTGLHLGGQGHSPSYVNSCPPLGFGIQN